MMNFGDIMFADFCSRVEDAQKEIELYPEDKEEILGKYNVTEEDIEIYGI